MIGVALGFALRFLRGTPWWLWAAAAVLAAFAAQHGLLSRERVKVAALSAQVSVLDSRMAAMVKEADAAARKAKDEREAEEARRAEAQREVVKSYELQIQKSRADAAIASAAAGSLRERVAALVAAAREASRNPQAVAPSAPADDPAGVLADLLGRCSARVQLLAATADERGAAGTACERQYDSLTPP